MDDSYKNISTSHLLGSVPAVISAEKEKSSTSYEAPEANLQIFPPNHGGDGGRGYQTLVTPTDGFEQQPANGWRGVFSVSSYTQDFNVDTDIVLNRLLSLLYPIGGDFFCKIDSNPEYGVGGVLSRTADVYSFGIMLMEIFTKKKPTDDMFSEEMNLKQWVQNSIQNELIDSDLLRPENRDYFDSKDCVTSILELALTCSASLREVRIDIKTATSELNKIKKFSTSV